MCDGSVTTQLCDILPTDIPAIVVSAGPSLNKNIVELRKAKNKAFIVAVDTAVKPLVKAGIIPDLYVVVDVILVLLTLLLSVGATVTPVTYESLLSNVTDTNSLSK